MASMIKPKLQVSTVGDDIGLIEPMKPSSQCINTSVLSLNIIAIAGSETPIDHLKIMEVLERDLLRVNPCFSSIVVRDQMTGLQYWKRVEVRIEDHVVVPKLPMGLGPEAYTECFNEYLSNVSLQELCDERPLWELHLFKYPTCDAAGTFVFKMHHALGDGFSIMGAIFSCFKRADNPLLPLSFPSASASLKWVQGGETKGLKKMLSIVGDCWSAIGEVGWSVLRSTVLEDDPTVIRSTTPGVECMPSEIASVTFALDDVKQVKSKINVTVNDVVVGTVFYGTELYIKAMNAAASEGARRTALVLVNTRMLNGYRSLEDMIEKDLWGNNFSFIHLPLPSIKDWENIEPLNFIFRASQIIKRNRNPLTIDLNGRLLRLLGRLKGTQAMSQYIRSTLWNSSMAISNLIGPTEKMIFAEHPINHIYFTVIGSPQSLLFTVMSYRGELRIVVKSEKGFIDSQILISCLKEAFEKIFEAARRLDE